MINYKTVIPALEGLIGWRQNSDPSGELIDSILTQTSSGLYYNDQHPVLTFDNLKSISPDFDNYTYPTWNSSDTYTIGQVVNRNGNLYRALLINTNQDPEDGGSYDESYGDDYDIGYWERFLKLSTWIQDKTRAGIQESINSFLEYKPDWKTVKSLLEDKYVFQGAGRLADQVQDRNMTVGWALEPNWSKDMYFQLKRVGLQFTQAQSVTLYLWHTSQTAYLKTVTLAYTKAGSFQWFDLTDWALPYFSSDKDAGGNFYVTYKQDSISGAAINRQIDLYKPCGNCNKYEYNDFQAISRFVSIYPFWVPQDGTSMFDIDEIQYDSSNNFGLNFQISAYCDYTNLFLDQKQEFASYIAKKVAIEFLKEAYYNSNAKIDRYTQNQVLNNKKELYFEIYGSPNPSQNTLYKRANDALAAIKTNFNGLSRVCLPCARRGVKIKAM